MADNETKSALLRKSDSGSNAPEPSPNCNNTSDITEATQPRRHLLFLTAYTLTICLISTISYTAGRSSASTTDRPTSSPPTSSQLVVESLWATPLARTHLRTHPQIHNLTQVNQRLADAVSSDYDAFRGLHNGTEGGHVNDLFFEHQTGARGEAGATVRARMGQLTHRQLPEFGVIASAAAELAERMLTRMEVPMKGRTRGLQAWATFHDDTSRHALHVHAESTLSIVYYVRMGLGAPLRLYDPRGPRPPFEGSVEVWPEEGEMVAFPGWLAHEVEAGSGRRVSLVFNVAGNWEGDEFCGDAAGLGRWQGVKGWRVDFMDGAL